MLYQNKDTGQFGLTIGEVRREFPNSSIPDDTVEIGQYVGYVETAMPTISWNENVTEVQPVNGRQKWEVTTADADELQSRINTKIEQVRTQRSPLFFRSDWTQLADSPLSAEDKALWCDYRQALRDITQQSGFPWTIVWPTPPASQR